MKKHPYHNLWIHDDHEIISHVKMEIRKRVTIHEWPLSCVQKITFDDDRILIYKSQYGPTVEPEFYAVAESPILPAADMLWSKDSHSCMLIEFIDAPQIGDLELSENEALRTGNEILAEIRAVTGEPPYYLDISGPEKWLSLVDTTISDLHELVAKKRFNLTSSDTVKIIEACARSSNVVSASSDDTGLIHGDPSGSNVFILPEGYRIVDWQRTKQGPREIDMVAFLYWRGIDPADHVNPGIVAMWYFLGINWLTQCKKRWIPSAISYDGKIVEFAAEMAKLLA